MSIIIANQIYCCDIESTYWGVLNLISASDEVVSQKLDIAPTKLDEEALWNDLHLIQPSPSTGKVSQSCGKLSRIL